MYINQQYRICATCKHYYVWDGKCRRDWDEGNELAVSVRGSCEDWKFYGEEETK
jgi:hypothetical protein